MVEVHGSLVELYAKRWRGPELRQRIALRSRTGDITYNELSDKVSRIAGGLYAAGVRRGAYVALAMERSTELVLALLGTMAVGACPCPLEPRLSAEELQRRLEAVRIPWIMRDTHSGSQFSLIDRSVSESLSFEDTVQGGPYWDAGIGPEDPGLLLFTTGSTGKPKGVVLNHRGLKNNADGVVVHTQLGHADTLLHIMPLYHTNGINNQLLAPLSVGACVALAPRFKAQDISDHVRVFSPTIITGVPTMFSRVLKEKVYKRDLRALRFIRCGSAPITKELHRRIEAFWDREVLISYGLSEATCTSTMNPPGRRKIGSVGTVLKGQDVLLRSNDGSHHQCPDLEGEICIAGESLMTGYVGVSESLQSSPIRDNILATGDLGRFDKDGYLYVTGRVKDVIIRGGENLAPGLMENVLVRQPDVMECCVVGVPDGDLGEVPVAFVVPEQGHDVDNAALQRAVETELGRVYRLSRVISTTGLPLNSVGKVDRKALMARLSQMG